MPLTVIIPIVDRIPMMATTMSSSIIVNPLFLILFFSGGSRFLFGFLLIPISDDLSVTRTALSGAATMFMVISAVSMPVFGRLLDKYDMKWVLAIAAILGVLGLSLMGVVNKVWHIFLILIMVLAYFQLGNLDYLDPNIIVI